MEKKPPLVMTPFDESLTNDFLQLVKIILPYLPDHVQRIAGIYVKRNRTFLFFQEKDRVQLLQTCCPDLSPAFVAALCDYDNKEVGNSKRHSLVP